ncbi:MAG TPA: YcxB family protein [Clostridia bacterium]|nr:YcxB family protein [Clostridia bacterium]
METKVEVDINYNEKETRKVVIYFLNHVNKLWIAFPCFAAVLISIILDAIHKRLAEYSYGLLAVYLIAFLAFYGWFYLRIPNGFVEFYKKRKGGTYTFSDSDVKIVGSEIQSICAWSVFKEAFETPSALLLSDTNKFLYIFPKRCFKSSEDVEELRRILNSKFKKFKRYL